MKQKSTLSMHSGNASKINYIQDNTMIRTSHNPDNKGLQNQFTGQRTLYKTWSLKRVKKFFR